MLTAALLKIARNWKHSKCPSVDEWIKERHIYTTKYCLAIKMNYKYNSAIKTCCNMVNFDGKTLG